MQNEQVSIVVPAYNAQEYIQNSIISALNQSYSKIEILIIDDDLIQLEQMEKWISDFGHSVGLLLESKFFFQRLEKENYNFISGGKNSGIPTFSWFACAASLSKWRRALYSL